MAQKFKIVYAEDNVVIRDLLGSTIEGELECELVEFDSGNELISYMKENDDVKLVLTDYNMPDGNGGDVYSYLKESGNKVPCLLISSDFPEDHAEFSDFYQTNSYNHYFEKPFDIEKVLNFIKKLVPSDSDREYKPVKIERFFNHNPVSVDVYIRLSEQKYVKLIKEGDVFIKGQLQRYIDDEKIKFFYVKAAEFKQFIDSFSEQLESILSQKDLKFENRFETELVGAAFIHDICNDLGINEVTIDTVNAITKSTVSTIKKSNPKVFKMVLEMMTNDGFLYSHSLMTSYISCEIAQKMEWSTSSIYKKFSIASLLHDIGLSEASSRVNILTNESLSDSLSAAELNFLKEHPQLNYELVHEIESFPSDVGTLILTHHERPDGSGFPRGLGSLKTSPLSCTFNLAHEFVHHFFEHNCDSSKVEDILQILKTEFNVGNYKKPFEALVQIVGK